MMRSATALPRKPSETSSAPMPETGGVGLDQVEVPLLAAQGVRGGCRRGGGHEGCNGGKQGGSARHVIGKHAEPPTVAVRGVPGASLFGFMRDYLEATSSGIVVFDGGMGATLEMFDLS